MYFSAPTQTLFGPRCSGIPSILRCGDCGCKRSLGYNQGVRLMGDTALHQRVDQIASGTYLGVNVALHWGDPTKEFSFLRESYGVFGLPWRAKIAVTGKDRVRWLHNMVTNNVRDLALNRGNYNFVLNAQGRILG